MAPSKARKNRQDPLPVNKIYIPATKPEDWKQFLAEPEKHWSNGYSAKCLAYSWQEADGFPAEVKNAFKGSQYDILQNLEILFAIPEYKVNLPGGGHASQNDLFVLAKTNEQLITIMVEGKVSESFGPLVSEWYQSPSAGKKKRLEYLCKILNLDKEKISNIRYQLIHRTASAIIEAGRFNAPNALMLIHSFSKNNEWFGDYDEFVKLYDVKGEVNTVHYAGKMKGVELYLGWVKGKA